MVNLVHETDTLRNWGAYFQNTELSLLESYQVQTTSWRYKLQVLPVVVNIIIDQFANISQFLPIIKVLQKRNSHEIEFGRSIFDR